MIVCGLFAIAALLMDFIMDGNGLLLELGIAVALFYGLSTLILFCWLIEDCQAIKERKKKKAKLQKQIDRG